MKPDNTVENTAARLDEIFTDESIDELGKIIENIIYETPFAEDVLDAIPIMGGQITGIKEWIAKDRIKNPKKWAEIDDRDDDMLIQFLKQEDLVPKSD